jgi:succinoglycan biosynthesis protein ExoW
MGSLGEGSAAIPNPAAADNGAGRHLDEQRSAMRIAVVIPFFQRERGLLARAVASIAAQELESNQTVEVIVVDDGSPSPAAFEPFPHLPSAIALRILQQENRGVGAARNAGLDAILSGTDCVAFLDSDDVWGARHLASALACLRAGADFYFDNNLIDEGYDAFSHSSYIRSTHVCIDPSNPQVIWLTGEACFRAMLHECIAHTSQVVYDFRRHGAVRFDSDLRRAGEDQIFWLDVSRHSRKVAIATEVLGRRGRGVSIYRGTLAWDSPNVLSRLADQIIMRNKIAGRFDLPTEQLRALRADAQKVCNHFVFLGLRNASRQPRAIVEALSRLTRQHPMFWTMVPASLIGLPAYRRQLYQGGGGRSG